MSLFARLDEEAARIREELAVLGRFREALTVPVDIPARVEPIDLSQADAGAALVEGFSQNLLGLGTSLDNLRIRDQANLAPIAFGEFFGEWGRFLGGVEQATDAARSDVVDPDALGQDVREIGSIFGAFSSGATSVGEALAFIDQQEADLETQLRRLEGQLQEQVSAGQRREEIIQRQIAAENEAAQLERERLRLRQEQNAREAFQARIRDLSLTTQVTDLNIQPQGVFAQPRLPERGPVTFDFSRETLSDLRDTMREGFGFLVGDLQDLFGRATTFEPAPPEPVEPPGIVAFQDLSVVQQSLIFSTNELTDSFGNFISAVASGSAELGQAASDFAANFVNVLLDALVLRPLAANTATLLGGLFGIGQTLPGNQLGGPFEPGLLVTGERGPEANFFSRPGFTLNAEDTEQLLRGGSGVSAQVNFYGDVNVDSDARMQQLAEEIGVQILIQQERAGVVQPTNPF